MDFQLSDEQTALVEMAHQFTRSEITPYAADWDKRHFFPIDTLKKAAALGFGALYVNPEYHGSGLSRLDAALIFETLAKGCPAFTAYLSIHNMVAGMIDRYGNHEQKEHYLPKLASMEVLASYCLTEPNAGSDAASLQTTALRNGDYFIINGSKSFCSGAGASDLYAVMARTGDQSTKGISCILVDAKTPGVSFGKKEEKLGWNCQPTSMVFFENCKVPTSQLLGVEGEGFKIALNGLNGGRINIAACSLGGAAACLAHAIEHVKQRQQFKKALAEFQHIQFTLASMATQLQAAQLMVYRAACALDHTDNQTMMYCAMAKKFATDAGFQIVNQALQLFGGYGYLQEYPIEKYFRDLRVHQILEGTNEIMQLVISRQLLS